MNGRYTFTHDGPRVVVRCAGMVVTEYDLWVDDCTHDRSDDKRLEQP